MTERKKLNYEKEENIITPITKLKCEYPINTYYVNEIYCSQGPWSDVYKYFVMRKTNNGKHIVVLLKKKEINEVLKPDERKVTTLPLYLLSIKENRKFRNIIMVEKTINNIIYYESVNSFTDIEGPWTEKYKYGLIIRESYKPRIIMHNEDKYLASLIIPNSKTIDLKRYLMSVKLGRIINDDESIMVKDKSKSVLDVENLLIVNRKNFFNYVTK